MAEHRPNEVRRKLLHGTNFTVYTLAVLAIIVLCNWFVHRNDHHLDLTPNKLFSLSAQSVKLVKGIDRPVTIYAFDQQSGFQNHRDVLNLYSSASHYITVRYVDPNRDPALARQFGVQNYGTIYVAMDARHVKASGDSEQGITNALIGLLKGQKTIYFVQGHGERDLASSSPQGYSQFEQALRNEDSQVKTLVLMKQMQIPSDCSVLVVAGPKNDYLPPEITAIEKYLQSGGRVLAFLDPAVSLPNLSGMLANYGVKPRNDLVIDENPVSRIFGTSPSMPLILSYGDNPIVQPLKRIATLFPLSRSFVVDSGLKPDVTTGALCNTSAASFSVTDFNTNMKQVSFRPGKDIKGPLVVAAAATLNNPKPSPEGRLVAAGTSLIAANAYLGFQGNRDLVMNMVEWLTSNEGLISVRPKAPSAQHLNLSARQMGGLLLHLIVIPLGIIVIGIGVWWTRRT
ncbi:MAG: GldG family protein [Terriglobia bacterium]